MLSTEKITMDLLTSLESLFSYLIDFGFPKAQSTCQRNYYHQREREEQEGKLMHARKRLKSMKATFGSRRRQISLIGRKQVCKPLKT